MFVIGTEQYDFILGEERARKKTKDLLLKNSSLEGNSNICRGRREITTVYDQVMIVLAQTAQHRVMGSKASEYFYPYIGREFFVYLLFRVNSELYTSKI